MTLTHRRTLWLAAAAAGLLLFPGTHAAAQPARDPTAALQAQAKAMAAFDMLKGRWRGSGWAMGPDGVKRDFAQTERVGPLLHDSLLVIEGRGYAADGSTIFNAFAVLSYDPRKDSYGLRSYAEGSMGDFPIRATGTGFSWEIAAGPATIRYVAEIKDGAWHETGERATAGGAPVRFLDMTLKRLGDTDWPGAGAVPPRD